MPPKRGTNTESRGKRWNKKDYGNVNRLFSKSASISPGVSPSVMRQISTNSDPSIIEGQTSIIMNLEFGDYIVEEPLSQLETLKLLNELYNNLMEGLNEPLENIEGWDKYGLASTVGYMGRHFIPVFGNFKNSLDNLFSSQKDQNLYFIESSCKALGDIDKIDDEEEKSYENNKKFLEKIKKIFESSYQSSQSRENFLEKYNEIIEKIEPKSDKEKLEDTVEIILGILEDIFITTVKIEIKNNRRIVESITNPEEQAENIIHHVFYKIDEKSDVIIKILKKSCNSRSKDIKDRKKRLKGKKPSLTEEEKEKKREEISGVLDTVVTGKTDLFGNHFEGGRKTKSLRGKNNRKTNKKHKRKNSTKKK